MYRLMQPSDWAEVLALWQAQCSASVTGWAMPAGHFIPEQLPEETAAALKAFFG